MRQANPSFLSICVLLYLTLPAIANAELLADSTACLVKPKQVVQLGSSVFGVLAELRVGRADVVTKGQIIGKLDTSVEEAQLALNKFQAQSTSALRAAQTDLAFNQRELERQVGLAKNMWSRIDAVDGARTKVAEDEIAIEKAKDEQNIAQLETARSLAQYNLRLIRSPLNGVVSDVKLEPGEFIYETTPIVTLAQLDPLTVDLVLPNKLYGSVKIGEAVELHLLEPVDKVVNSTIDVIDPLIDPASDTFRVRLTLRNPGNKIPAGIRCVASLAGASQ